MDYKSVFDLPGKARTISIAIYCCLLISCANSRLVSGHNEPFLITLSADFRLHEQFFAFLDLTLFKFLYSCKQHSRLSKVN